jgi:hypothetical protein
MQFPTRFHPPLTVYRRIAPHFIGISKEIHSWIAAHLLQLPRDDEPIAAVVPFAAQNDCASPFQMCKSLAHKPSDTRSRIFHERQARDAMTLRRQPVDFPHFDYCECFHCRITGKEQTTYHQPSV